jgi:hypothetical protein
MTLLRTTHGTSLRRKTPPLKTRLTYGSGAAKTFTASCFNSTQDRESTYYNDINIISDPEDTAAIGRLWGGSQVLSNACYNYPGFREKGSLVSTAFSARDLMQIVDAVESDGLLRYWGLSYRTVLGLLLLQCSLTELNVSSWTQWRTRTSLRMDSMPCYSFICES